MIFISTVTTGHRDVLKALDLLKKLKIDNIELGAFHDPVSDINKVIKFKKDNNTSFTVHAFFPPVSPSFMLNFGSSEPELLKKYIDFAKHAIEFCRKIDALIYSVHAGYNREIDTEGKPISEKVASDNTVFENTKNSLIEIADYAKNYDLKIAVENQSSLQGHMFFPLPENMLKLVNAVNAKNLGILLDIGHLNVASHRLNFNFKEAIENLKDNIFEFHIHHNNGDLDEHKPLPDDSLIKYIPKEIGKKCVLVLEGADWKEQDILNSKKILESSFL